jgi:hypothetical protein
MRVVVSYEKAEEPAELLLVVSALKTGKRALLPLKAPDSLIGQVLDSLDAR